MKSKLRLGLYFGLLVGLTVIGIRWVLYRHQFQLSWADIGLIKSFYLGLALVIGLLIYPVDAIRYKINGKALNIRINWRSCFEVSIINFFFSWISPSGFLGIPASSYYLSKKELLLSEAVLLTSAKSFLSVGIFLMATFLLVATTGFSILESKLSWLLFFGGALYMSFFLVPVLLALLPGFSERFCNFVKRISLERDDLLIKIMVGLERSLITLRSLFRNGGIWVVAIVLSHLFYYFTLLSVGMSLLIGVGGLGFLNEDSWLRLSLFLGTSLVAPSPSGAGFAEATVNFLFGSVIDIQYALVVCLAFRSLTYFLQVAIGFLWLIFNSLIGKHKFFAFFRYSQQ